MFGSKDVEVGERVILVWARLLSVLLKNKQEENSQESNYWEKTERAKVAHQVEKTCSNDSTETKARTRSY